MAKRRFSGRVRVMRETRPLIFSFADSEALLQFATGCRRLALGAPVAALYRVAGGYRLIFWGSQSIPPALFALLSETASISGCGAVSAAAVVTAGTPLSEDLLGSFHRA